MKKQIFSPTAMHAALLTAVLVFLSFCALSGQPTNFIRNYSYLTQGHMFSSFEDIAVLNSGEVATIGISRGYPSNLYSVFPFLMLSNAEGDPIWTQVIGTEPDTAGLWRVVAGNDGSAVVTGFRNDTAFVAKVSVTGQVVWSTALSYFNYKMRSPLDLVAGNQCYYLVGAKAPHRFLSSSRIVARIEENGTLTWLKRFQIPGGVLDLQSMAIGVDGNLGVYGWGGITSSSQGYINPTIVIDSSGNVVSARAYKYPSEPIGSPNESGEILALQNGGFARIDWFNPNRAHLIRMDAAGSVLWAKVISGDISPRLHMVPDLAGGMIIVGKSNIQNNPGRIVPVSIKLDASGTYWGSLYVDTYDFTYPNEVVAGLNCDYYLVGAQDWQQQYHALLGRSDVSLGYGSGQSFPGIQVLTSQVIDSALSILPEPIVYSSGPLSLSSSFSPINFVYDSTWFSTAQVPCLTTSNDPVMEYVHLSVFPNPVVDVLHVVAKEGKSISWLKLHDLQGKLVGQVEEGKSQMKLSMDELEGGVYFLSVGIGGRVVTRKVVKQ